MAGSSPFVGEISIVGFNFPPKGWTFCDGQLLPISQNTALFSILGTYYGGDGKSTFSLPNFQGRAPMHAGNGPGLSTHVLGETGGEENVTLLETEMPAHSHEAQAIFPIGDDTNQASLTDNPVNSFPIAKTGTNVLFSPSGSGKSGSFKPEISVIQNGGGLPHNNMQPYLTLNFIIAMQGVYPPRQ